MFFFFVSFNIWEGIRLRTRIEWDYFTSHLMTATRLCKQNFVVSALRSMRSDTCQILLFHSLAATSRTRCQNDGNISIELKRALCTHTNTGRQAHTRSLASGCDIKVLAASSVTYIVHSPVRPVSCIPLLCRDSRLE